MNTTLYKHGFTLMEMMVVIGILGILMGATVSGVGQARERARVAKANTEVRELVSAILAYEAAEEELDKTGTDGEDATEALLNRMHLLGDGGKPVYLNAPMTGNPKAFRDPWGTPYKIRIGINQESSSMEMLAATITFPNRLNNARW